MTIANLIASTGLRTRTPVQRYLETKSQVDQEERNRLASLATQQSIDIRQKQEQRTEQAFQLSKEESFGKAVTPLIERIDDQPDKQAAYEAALPEMDRLASQFGVDTRNFSDVFDQKQADILISRFGEKEKGQFKQMIDPKGKLRQGRIVGGRVFDRDGSPQPDWSVAPGRQEAGEPGAFTKSGKNKLETQAFEQEEGIYRLTNNLNNLKKFINSPDYVGGVTGDIISAGNSIVQQMRQFTGLGDFSQGSLPKKDIENPKGEFSALRKAAINGDRRSGLIIELAYNIAKSFDKGGRVTDADFKFAREVIEGSADRVSTIAKIDDFMKRSQQNYTASDKLISERLGRKPRPYSDEEWRRLYNIEQPTQAPVSDADQLARELIESFGTLP